MLCKIITYYYFQVVTSQYCRHYSPVKMSYNFNRGPENCSQVNSKKRFAYLKAISVKVAQKNHFDRTRPRIQYEQNAIDSRIIMVMQPAVLTEQSVPFSLVPFKWGLHSLSQSSLLYFNRYTARKVCRHCQKYIGILFDFLHRPSAHNNPRSDSKSNP